MSKHLFQCILVGMIGDYQLRNQCPPRELANTFLLTFEIVKEFIGKPIETFIRRGIRSFIFIHHPGSLIEIAYVHVIQDLYRLFNNFPGSDVWETIYLFRAHVISWLLLLTIHIVAKSIQVQYIDAVLSDEKLGYIFLSFIDSFIYSFVFIYFPNLLIATLRSIKINYASGTQKELFKVWTCIY